MECSFVVVALSFGLLTSLAETRVMVAEVNCARFVDLVNRFTPEMEHALINSTFPIEPQRAESLLKLVHLPGLGHPYHKLRAFNSQYAQVRDLKERAKLVHAGVVKWLLQRSRAGFEVGHVETLLDHPLAGVFECFGLTCELTRTAVKHWPWDEQKRAADLAVELRRVDDLRTSLHDAEQRPGNEFWVEQYKKHLENAKKRIRLIDGKPDYRVEAEADVLAAVAEILSRTERQKRLVYTSIGAGFLLTDISILSKVVVRSSALEELRINLVDKLYRPWKEGMLDVIDCRGHLCLTELQRTSDMMSRFDSLPQASDDATPLLLNENPPWYRSKGELYVTMGMIGTMVNDAFSQFGAWLQCSGRSGQCGKSSQNAGFGGDCADSGRPRIEIAVFASEQEYQDACDDDTAHKADVVFVVDVDAAVIGADIWPASADARRIAPGGISVRYVADRHTMPYGVNVSVQRFGPSSEPP